MDELYICTQGVTALVRARSEKMQEIVAQLANDFKALVVSGGEIAVTLDLVEQTPVERAGKGLPRFVFQVSIARVYGWGRHRVCRYFGDVTAESKYVNGLRCFWVSGHDPDLLHEAAYTILLSALGEELDARGFHRVHALGVELSGRRALILAPSGGGKSAMAGLLMRSHSRAKLFSDESPLLHRADIYPFPIRLALRPEVAEALCLGEGTLFKRRKFPAKMRLPFPENSCAKAGPIDVLMIGVPTSGAPSIQRKTRLSAFPALFVSLVIGVGLAQMSEWMLRLNALPRLMEIALRRTVALVHVLARVEVVYEFKLGLDARENAACLDSFVAGTCQAEVNGYAQST